VYGLTLRTKFGKDNSEFYRSCTRASAMKLKSFSSRSHIQLDIQTIKENNHAHTFEDRKLCRLLASFLSKLICMWYYLFFSIIYYILF